MTLVYNCNLCEQSSEEAPPYTIVAGGAILHFGSLACLKGWAASQ